LDIALYAECKTAYRKHWVENCNKSGANGLEAFNSDRQMKEIPCFQKLTRSNREILDSGEAYLLMPAISMTMAHLEENDVGFLFVLHRDAMLTISIHYDLTPEFYRPRSSSSLNDWIIIINET
jgi:hypothetical protein